MSEARREAAAATLSSEIIAIGDAIDRYNNAETRNQIHRRTCADLSKCASDRIIRGQAREALATLAEACRMAAGTAEDMARLMEDEPSLKNPRPDGKAQA